MNDTEIEVLSAIKEFIKENGFAPTVREIGEIVGLSSPSSVLDNLRKLKEKGYITYIEKKSRTIKVVK
jgi:repressor LexA